MKVATFGAICLMFGLLQRAAGQDDYRQSSGNLCGMEGDAKSQSGKTLDRNKNRYVPPEAGDIDPVVTLDAMLTPGDDEGRFDETKVAMITGFVIDVKVGGTETCNCHAEDPIDRDTHIELALSEQAPEIQRVIVEVTPRMRAQMSEKGIDWSTEALQDTDSGIKGKWVQISGWMLFDSMHLKQAENTAPGNPKNWRATCWEIHPVTDIQVLDGPPPDASQFQPIMLARFQAVHSQHAKRDPRRKDQIERRNEAYFSRFDPSEQEDAEKEAEDRKAIGAVALAPAAPKGNEPIDEDRAIPDRPAQAAEFRALLTGGGPNAEIRADALPKAVAKVNELRVGVATRFEMQPQALMINAGSGNPATVGGIPVGPLAGAETPLDGSTEIAPLIAPLHTVAAINPAGWKWSGPGNIGGRVRSILVHPNQPQVIWVGGVAGGVWKSTNGGVSWSPLYDLMASVAVSCMAMDPRNSNTIFAGTGEGYYNADSVRGFGIFVSRNGGANWKQLPATANDLFRYVNRMAIARSSGNSSVMLAATRNGLFRSTDLGTTFHPVSAPMNGEILDVRFHPTNSQQCVASSRNGRAFYSSNGGIAWTAATGIAAVAGFGGRVELTYARANGNVVFASVDDGTGKVYRSTDGGKTYTLRNTPGHLAGQGWYANCVWAGDPTTPNFLIVGGLDLYRSTNGGQTFTKISQWQSSPTSAHADHHAIVAHPNYNGTTVRTVLFGNDGGVYRADNVATVLGTTGWQELNNGLGITQFYGAAAHPPTGKIVGGAQDNGTLFFTPAGGANGWKEISGGDGGESAADPVQELYYGEYIRLQIHRSQSGAPSTYIWNGITEAGSNAALFIAPFVLDPNNSSRMLAGGSSLWRSNNVSGATPAWSAIKPPLAQISAIAVGPGAPKVVWVGYTTGVVHRSADATNSTPSWSAVGAGLEARYCSRITFDAHDPKLNTVYVTSTGYSRNNLHKTIDGGATWIAIGAGALPDIPFYDITVHPEDQNLLYLATELGLFVSDNAGTTWSPTNQGPTNAPVYRLFWLGNTLYSVTHGRGIFHIDLSRPASESVTPQPSAAAVIDP